MSFYFPRKDMGLILAQGSPYSCLCDRIHGANGELQLGAPHAMPQPVSPQHPANLFPRGRGRQGIQRGPLSHQQSQGYGKSARSACPHPLVGLLFSPWRLDSWTLGIISSWGGGWVTREPCLTNKNNPSTHLPPQQVWFTQTRNAAPGVHGQCHLLF